MYCTNNVIMNTIAISELRANLMKVLKEIKSGARINITSRGKVIAKLVPPDNVVNDSQKKLEELEKTAVIKDIISPVDTKWKVKKEE